MSELADTGRRCSSGAVVDDNIRLEARKLFSDCRATAKQLFIKGFPPVHDAGKIELLGNVVARSFAELPPRAIVHPLEAGHRFRKALRASRFHDKATASIQHDR